MVRTSAAKANGIKAVAVNSITIRTTATITVVKVADPTITTKVAAVAMAANKTVVVVAEVVTSAAHPSSQPTL